MSAGVGQRFTTTEDDTVYYDEELAHDFCVMGIGDSMGTKVSRGSVALIHETDSIMMGRLCGGMERPGILSSTCTVKDGLRLVSFNPDLADLFAP